MRTRTITLSLVVLLWAIFAGTLEARTCGGVADVSGSYGFVAYRAFGMETAPTLTVPAPLSMLIAGTTRQMAFDTVGVLGFDGSGNVLASSTSGYPNVVAGTYAVNTDCSITVTLNDVFNPNTTPSTVVQSASSSNLAGAILESAAEIDLIATAPAGAGATVILKKAMQASGCTTASLAGNYALGFSGVSTDAQSGESTAVNAIWRIVADGTGNLVADTPAVNSPVKSIQATGTYTVNADCTGTAALTTGSGQSAVITNIAFVLATAPGSVTTPGRTTARPELEFVPISTSISGGGVGRLQ